MSLLKHTIRAFLIVILATSFSSGAWLVQTNTGSKVMNHPRRVVLKSGKVFKQKWFYNSEKLKKWGVKYWKEVRDFDERYYKSTGYSEEDTIAPDGVPQIIRTHIFTEKYTFDQLKQMKVNRLNAIAEAVAKRQIIGIMTDYTLTNKEMLTALTAKRAEIVARRQEIGQEISACSTYEEAIEYNIQWKKQGEIEPGSGVTK